MAPYGNPIIHSSLRVMRRRREETADWSITSDNWLWLVQRLRVDRAERESERISNSRIKFNHPFIHCHIFNSNFQAFGFSLVEIILVTNGEREEALPWLSAAAERGSQWNDTSPVKTCEKVLRAFNHFQTLILQPIVSNSSELKVEAARKRTKPLFSETLNINIGSMPEVRRANK